MCEKGCDAGRGISNYVAFVRGVSQVCTLSPNLFKVYIDGMIVVVEAAKQGVTVEEDAVSGMMYEDDFVGISEISEGLQNKLRR